ncbi:MAG: cytochrome c biogenesis CcdA family protein [Actinobacteria bacterium]|nr:cytochrome c biogenesis CcdA family protein [Actinomycetota bacterium]MBU1942242.1 cytochrome c biogenesis CcdA family protein [Actinomycetota bacterium]MBU2687409.1 cytochrome c biogenesis CcdA family protein [Actinomycetota bacterium]
MGPNSRATASTQDGVVEFMVFTNEGCPECESLNKELLPGLEATYGSRIKYQKYDFDKFDDFRLMINLENAYGRTEMSVPQVYIGTSALIGPDEVGQNLEKKVEEYLAAGGVDMPVVPQDGAPATVSEKPVYIAYFYGEGCRECDAIDLELSYLKKYGGNVTVREYDMSRPSSVKMNEAMCQTFGVPPSQRGTYPALFVGSEYLEGKTLNRKALEGAIAKSRLAPESVIPWEASEHQLEEASKLIDERFSKLGLPTVLVAGLVDGLNPCAFTVLVFLISYLAFVGKRKGEVLAIGGAFTATVYATYTLIGIGLFSFIRAIGPSGTAGRWLTGIVAGLTAAFGLLAITDYFRARKTGRAGPGIGMGGNATRRVHEAIRKHTRPAYLLAGAVVLGFLVTVMELGCTGQVYLPTITFVARAGDDKLRAVVYLLVYNLMFVLPLIVVFLLAYFGTSRERFVQFGRKHSATLELVGGLVLVALAVLLFVTL